MIDKVFQIIGKRSVAPDGVVQYPVQDELTGEVLTMNMGIEDSGFLVPGAFLCHDTGSGNNVLCPAGSLAKTAERYGLKDVTLRFGKVLKVYPIKGSASKRIDVTYIADSENSFTISSVNMHPGPNTDLTKYPPIVDGRIIVLALSASDLGLPLAAWPLEGDV
ncbi:MAG: hypothetical protein LBL31_08200 [Spirochaetaceae bacterium]|jgi:hypothetical protein|nr:hypothetical protein [Spirochaetaceae bacterium]